MIKKMIGGMVAVAIAVIFIVLMISLVLMLGSLYDQHLTNVANITCSK